MTKYSIRKDPFKYFRLAKENILYPGRFKFNFVVVGVQKAGTTALDRYLRDHPKVAMPKWKELSYFNNDKAYENNTLPNPRAFYHIKNRLKIYGECTPCYIYSHTAVERMKKHNPKMKIIAILRNPIERAFSQWNMEISRDWEKRSFKECIEEEIAEINAGTKEYHMVRSYVHRGLYAEQIQRIYSEFPKEQVLFLKYEDLRDKPACTLTRIYSFLGVRPMNPAGEKKANVIKYQFRITENEKGILKDFFMPNIIAVEELLSWDCSDWKS